MLSRMFACVWEDACLCSCVFLCVFMLGVFTLRVVRSCAYVASLACLRTCRCCFPFVCPDNLANSTEFVLSLMLSSLFACFCLRAVVWACAGRCPANHASLTGMHSEHTLILLDVCLGRVLLFLFHGPRRSWLR